MTQGRIQSDATRGGVYLAGPSGFFEAGRLWHDTVVVPAIKHAGLIPMDPWADGSAISRILKTKRFGPARRSALEVANLEQGRLDLRLIDHAEAILACL